MRDNFIQIGRFGNVILFLILEFIAFYLIIQFNREQASIFFHSTNLLSSNVYERYDNINKYFNLNQIADSVLLENAQLRDKPLNYKYLTYGDNDTVQITSMEQQFVTVPVNVRSVSVNRWNNNIIIDKGKKDGIEDGMGVLGFNGVVGKTRLCTSHFCSVIPLIHSKSSISVRTGDQKFFGNLIWKNTNPKILSLEGVPQHATISVGQKVYTSGFSFIYPAGIEVGKILEINLPHGSNFYEISVELVNDFSSLSYAYVVKNIMKPEIDSLLTSPNQ